MRMALPGICNVLPCVREYATCMCVGPHCAYKPAALAPAPMENAHRALSDAEATAALLSRLIQDHGEERILEGVVSWPRALRA